MEYFVVIKAPKGKRLNSYLKGLSDLPLDDKQIAESVAKYTKERYPEYDVYVSCQYLINL